MTNKLTEKLAEKLEKTDASDLLEIILELGSKSESSSQQPSAQETRSRGEKIAALKEAFSRDAAPIEEAVRRVGGEVTGRAWINKTMRARVPAQSVKELSQHEEIAALDTPNPLKPDVA
jgi:hypothetical protein